MNTHDLVAVLSGAILAGYVVAGLFFWTFWRRTQDRLFVFFAAAFWVLALERALLIGTNATNEFTPFLYLVRLAAFALIAIAVIDKNRGPRS
jgi:Family of unknown function (DUF5985)